MLLKKCVTSLSLCCTRKQNHAPTFSCSFSFQSGRQQQQIDFIQSVQRGQDECGSIHVSDVTHAFSHTLSQSCKPLMRCWGFDASWDLFFFFYRNIISPENTPGVCTHELTSQSLRAAAGVCERKHIAASDCTPSIGSLQKRRSEAECRLT